MNIDTVKNLRYGDNPDVTWNTDDYTLPSNIKQEYIKTEILTTGSLKHQDINPPENYIALAREAASKNGVFLKFLLAIAEVSSGYNPNKVAQQGTRVGIMQLSIQIGALYKAKRNELFDPEKSFDIASAYIKDLHKQYNGDVEKILQAYFSALKPSTINQEIQNTPQSNVFTSEVMRRIDLNQPIIF
jgi:hypothetical protein